MRLDLGLYFVSYHRNIFIYHVIILSLLMTIESTLDWVYCSGLDSHSIWDNICFLFLLEGRPRRARPTIFGELLPGVRRLPFTERSMYRRGLRICPSVATTRSSVDIHLSLGEQLLLLGVAMLSSKGAAGVTGAGFITLAATLAVVPSVPVAGMALILGVDRFMSECRSLTNFVGNAVATVVVSKWEGGLDHAKLDAALGRKL